MSTFLETLKTRLRDRRILHLMKQAKKLSDQKEYEPAYKLYRQAAELGCVRALCIMAMMHYHGYGVAKDHRKAFLYLRFCAAKNDGEAQYFLAKFYRQGIYREVNPEQAVYWLQESANNPHQNQSMLPAQYELACMLLAGEGTDPNEEMAMYWFTEAANDGYEPAKAFLTNCMPGYVGEEQRAKNKE